MPWCERDEYEAGDDAAEGTDADDETAWSDADDANADTVTVPCPACGREIPDFADRCPSCGNWVMQGGGPAPRAGWVLPVVVIVVAGVLLWGVRCTVAAGALSARTAGG